MMTLIVTDDESFGTRLRRALLSKGRECPPECIVRHSAAGATLASASRTDLVVLDVGRDVETATSAVSRFRSVVGGRLVAVGELGTVRAALQIRRAGADEYVEAADALAELSAIVNGAGPNGAGQIPRGRVLGVLSPTGGGGASTLAVNLTVALAAELKQDLALIDLVPVTGCLADLLDLKPAHTLADLCEAPQRLDRGILERSLVRHETGVLVLASPRRYEARQRLTPEAIERLIELARLQYSWVVLDLDRELGPPILSAARLADGVVVALRQEFAALRDARQALEYLERNGVPATRLLPVATRRGQPRELPAAKVEEALRMKLVGAIPDDPKTAIRAANNGVPLVVEARSSRVARAITELARQLRARVETETLVR